MRSCFGLPFATGGGGAGSAFITGSGAGGTHPTYATTQHCGSCHGGTYTNTTVDKALHMNGVVDGGGHPAGWIEPDQHGLAALQENLQPCATCHVGFGSVGGGGAGTSCDACHADPSLYGTYAGGPYPQHADWKTECTFCHGGRGNTTGAPPRNTHVISSDLTTAQATTDATIGAHASHVTAAHGVSLAFDCTACHATRWSSATRPRMVATCCSTSTAAREGGTSGRTNSTSSSGARRARAGTSSRA